jgi:hypothetical protein
MQALFDLIRSHPWPVIGGVIAVVGALAAEVWSGRIHGGNFPDVSLDD